MSKNRGESMKWAMPPGGSIIPASKADKYLMSDGKEYSAYELAADPRNTHCLAAKTISHRLANGERDIGHVLDRRTTRPRKPSLPSADAYKWGRG